MDVTLNKIDQMTNISSEHAEGVVTINVTAMGRKEIGKRRILVTFEDGDWYVNKEFSYIDDKILDGEKETNLSRTKDIDE